MSSYFTRKPFGLISMLFLASITLRCAISFASELGDARRWDADVNAAQGINVTKDGAGLCNSVAFSQVPGHPDLFLGRLKENTGANLCSGNNWAMALFQMDWSKRQLHFVRYILKPPFVVQDDGRTINSAYDPYVIRFKDELWVAFECAASHSVSSCLGPLKLGRGIDISRVSIPASGGPKTSAESWQVSASDPKLLLWRDHLYLYWTVIRSDERGWIDGAVRGARVVDDTRPSGRLWIDQAGQNPVRSDDRNLTVEVWGPTPTDPLSNSFVDMFGIYSGENGVIATAGVGGRGTVQGEQCLSPGGTSFGCFRLTISKVSDPLARDVFNSGEMHPQGFPTNPQEYSRVVEDPTGRLFIMGMYFDPPKKYAAQYRGSAISRGLLLYPISVK